MKRTTLTIQTSHGPKEVTGSFVELLGFEDFTFIAHPAIAAPSRWTVSEAETGMGLPLKPYPTKSAAVEALRQRFEHLTPKGLRAAIDAQLKNLQK